mgnify:CR=1 FL=1
MNEINMTGWATVADLYRFVSSADARFVQTSVGRVGRPVGVAAHAVRVPTLHGAARA